MSARDEIADALTATGSARVAPYYRQCSRPGDGCIRWGGSSRDDSGLGVMVTWQAWIALPQDMRAAEEWLDQHLPGLIAAMETEAYVTDAQPAELIFGHNSINGLIIEAARPQESE